MYWKGSDKEKGRDRGKGKDLVSTPKVSKTTRSDQIKYSARNFVLVFHMEPRSLNNPGHLPPPSHAIDRKLDLKWSRNVDIKSSSLTHWAATTAPILINTDLSVIVPDSEGFVTNFEDISSYYHIIWSMSTSCFFFLLQMLVELN